MESGCNVYETVCFRDGGDEQQEEEDGAWRYFALRKR